MYFRCVECETKGCNPHQEIVGDLTCPLCGKVMVKALRIYRFSAAASVDAGISVPPLPGSIVGIRCRYGTCEIKVSDASFDIVPEGGAIPVFELNGRDEWVCDEEPIYIQR